MYWYVTAKLTAVSCFMILESMAGVRPGTRVQALRPAVGHHHGGVQADFLVVYIDVARERAGMPLE
jgi:hypothetical protein